MFLGNETRPSDVSELKLRSQERANQIKRAREEFLCISGSTEKKLSCTASVGALLSSSGKRDFQRLSQINTTNVDSNKHADPGQNKDSKSNPRCQKDIIFGVSGSKFSHNSPGDKQMTSNIQKENDTELNKSYSCPSSPKF